MKKLIKGYFDLGFVSVTLQMLISAKDFGLKLMEVLISSSTQRRKMGIALRSLTCKHTPIGLCN